MIYTKATMEEIRYMQADDKEFWFSLDRHLPEAEFEKKVRDRHGYGKSSWNIGRRT